jgi:hypothetical protein
LLQTQLHHIWRAREGLFSSFQGDDETQSLYMLKSYKFRNVLKMTFKTNLPVCSSHPIPTSMSGGEGFGWRREMVGVV